MIEHNILIVDDEPNILKSLNRLLMRQEYEVFAASSGAEGLRICSQKDIHLILSDYRMPEMNGVEFLSKVKSQFPAITRIVLSGFADAAAVVDAINEGQIYKFMSKPWDDSELLLAIRQGLEKHDLMVENETLNRELSLRNGELQKINANLEELVKERTRELELNLKALSVARNIINLLPLGVLGIDSSFTIVYMNNAVGKYISMDGLCLECDASEILPEAAKQAVVQTLVDGRERVCRVTEEVGAVCSPLVDNQGSVIIFFGRNLLNAFATDEVLENISSGGIHE
jgi:two-component system NtrC family sensor kinase